MSSPISILVVDDERRARRRIVDLIRDRDEVAEIRCADSGEKALTALRTGNYDLVFLDVQMPEKTGLEVASEIGPSNLPPTIFVTAYDQYAIEAFEHAALDYLLKPFDDQRFEKAYQRGLRIQSLQQTEAVAERLKSVLEEVPSAKASSSDESGGDRSSPSEQNYLKRINIDLPGKVRVVPVGEIQYITAEDVHVKIHTADDTYLLRERMHVLEDRLNPVDFMRIHRSTIVRLGLIEEVRQRPGGDYSVRLRIGKELSVGRSRHDELLNRIEGIIER